MDIIMENRIIKEWIHLMTKTFKIECEDNFNEIFYVSTTSIS